MDHNWIHDKELAGIDAQKLQTLASLSEQGHGLGQKELLPFLMTAASRTGKQSISFSNQEMQLILTVLKKDKSPEEQAKMDRLFALMQQMQHRTSY